MSDIADTDIVFDGINGITGDILVRMVRRRVLVERIHQDDQLIAHTAASYFQCPALTWYENQSEETQESWKLLRRAILNRWPPPTESGAHAVITSPTNFNIPTPAAAPPNISAVPSTAIAAPTEQVAPYEKPTSGRVRVVSENGRHIGYLSTTLNEFGHFKVTSSIPDIAFIKLVPNGPLHEMQIVNYLGEDVRIGVTWTRKESSQDLTDERAIWGALVKISSGGSSQKVQSSTAYKGPAGSQIWTILTNGQILASWEIKPYVHRELIFIHGSILSVTNDFKGFYDHAFKHSGPEKANALDIVKLFLEPT